MNKLIISIIISVVIIAIFIWWIMVLIKKCNHDYRFHKVRAQYFDGPEAEDYLIEFYQCSKCGRIKNIRVKDNIHIYKRR